MKLEKKKELLIEITNKCPFCCIFCSSFSSIKKNKFIESSDFYKIINDARDLGFEIIQLSGGEPFLHPEINKFIDFILKKGLFLEIYTCGNIYQDGKTFPIQDNILLKYKKNPKLSLRFNFQTINEEIFRKLTNSSKGLKNLGTSIKKCVKYGINTEVHIIPTSLNLTQIDSTIHYLLNELNITHVKILRLILHGRAQENFEKLIFSEKDLNQVILNINKKYQISEVEIGTAFSNLSNSCRECQAAKYKYMITVDLKIFPCTAFKNKTNLYVKINDKTSLKKIISHKLINRKIQTFNENLKCNYCLNREICSEICPIQKIMCTELSQFDLTKPLTIARYHH